MTNTIVDYSAGVPGAAAVKAAGHVGAIRYISDPREPWMKGKPVTKGELEDYRNHKMDVAFVYQFSKADTKRGFAGGVHDATIAQRRLEEIGCPNHPVFFTVDYDINIDQWNHTDSHYFRGAASVIGLHRVGIYGHSRVCAWAIEDKVVGHIHGEKHLCWVTRSWGSVDFEKYAVLFQRIVDSRSTPGPVINGVTVDVNDILHPEWGQLPRPARPGSTQKGENMTPPIQKHPGWEGDPTWLAPALRAFGVEVVESPGWDKWGMGDFGKIWGALAHHTGSNNTTPNLIRYGHEALRGLLSQIHLGRTGVATLVGIGIAYHAGVGSWPGLPKNNANWHTIGIEAVSDGTSPWPAEQMDAYYRICAAICWVLDVPASRIIAHHEWGKIQGKWDLGAGNGSAGIGMDMSEFRRNVQYYIDNPPFKETMMSNFGIDLDKLYPSRAEGSPYEGNLVDYWLNTDAHAFTARVNTVQILEELRVNNELTRESNELTKQNSMRIARLETFLGVKGE